MQHRLTALLATLILCMSVSAAQGVEVELATLAEPSNAIDSGPQQLAAMDWQRLPGQRTLHRDHPWWRLQLNPTLDSDDSTNRPDLIVALREVYDGQLLIYRPPDYQAERFSTFDPESPMVGSRQRLAFNVPAQDAQQPIYIQIESARAQPIGVEAAPFDRYQQVDLNRVRYMASVISTSLLMAVVALVFAVALQRQALVLLSIWVLSGAVYFLVLSGEIVALLPWPIDGPTIMRLNLASTNIGLVAGYAAMYQFLAVGRHFPRWASAYRWVLVLAALMVFVAPFINDPSLINQIINILLLLLATTTLTMAALLTRTQGSQAWFYLIGWGGVTLASMLRAYHFLTLQGTPFWLEYLHPAAHVSGAFVLVLATARAARYAEREMHDARSQARTDPLTGLPNRAMLDSRLNALSDNAEQIGRPLSVLFVDIDHFKPLNDHYGHAFGDTCLQHLAAILRRHVRANDLVARYGGEEFVLVLEADTDSAWRIAESLRSAVELESVAVDGTQINMTISVGLATRQVGEPADQLMHRADDALYKAKRGGRNRVLLAQPFDRSSMEPSPT